MDGVDAARARDVIVKVTFFVSLSNFESSGLQRTGFDSLTRTLKSFSMIASLLRFFCSIGIKNFRKNLN